MIANDFLQIAALLAALLILTPILGRLCHSVLTAQGPKLPRPFRSIERIVYKLCSINPDTEMNWKQYASALLLFNLGGFTILFLLQMLQGVLPLNPQNLPAPSWHSALNTAVSFVTNTNWQSYAGETTLSYLTQMVGLTVQNFVSAATGIAVMAALARGISRKTSNTIGNFWADMTRSTVHILLPLAVVWTLVLVGQGVVQNVDAYQTATTIEGKEQVLPMGPGASQIAIKQLGTNGGGFFNTNSAHPYENPTPLSNWFEVLAILMLPAALVYTFGLMVGSRKHAWILYGVMMLMLIAFIGISAYGEFSHNNALGVAHLEGKEARLGIVNSIIWSNFTTVASNGSVNAMHSSLSPITGGIAMFNIMLGEIIFGGVGAGMYGMILFVLLAVFLAGLMVGRTPEYFGKKIEALEMRWTTIAIILPCALILIGSAIACSTTVGLSSLANRGPHGLSEILYAFTSASGNNGSAFAGLNANTPFYNVSLALCMLLARFGVILPVLVIAGSLVRKKSTPMTAGSFSTEGMTFGLILIATILIVGALTFFPVLALGPILEHLLMLTGTTF
ncbi:MAG: potassium-transporting ATPase subunit KdpA [Candidatus Zixiibacteriota bacterium]